MRLLVVEDEQRIVEILATGLRGAGFIVDAVDTSRRAIDSLQGIDYDAMVLDLGLPDGDGLRVVRHTRERGAQLPILILTARDSVEDRVRGLDTGADDYLVKPFAVKEVVSRIKALLRRPGGALGTVLAAGNVTLDTIGRNAVVGETRAPLSRRELAVLEHLLRRMGRVVPREVLEEKLYGMDQEPESNAVPVHVHHLRRKLSAQDASVEIHTVRGIGYLLAERSA